ncbi:MAG: hypothetical protein Q8P13_05475 [bacterium]|nr:hypothetical protein [bacterium]
MGSKEGVKLLLEPGTRIRNWIRVQDLNIEVCNEERNGRNLRVLVVREGEASFIPGGWVAIRMPGSSEFWTAFAPLKVLEIRNLNGPIHERNWHMCIKCSTLTGKALTQPVNEGKYGCTVCGYQWRFDEYGRLMSVPEPLFTQKG